MQCCNFVGLGGMIVEIDNVRFRAQDKWKNAGEEI